jgi:uncharacterized protein (DUF58 family)
MDATVPRRGSHVLEAVRVRSRYPFGFLLKGRSVAVGAACLALPRILPAEETDLAVLDVLGSSERFQRGQGMDLYMIRDYQPSDGVRHVDWKASAKTSALKTREFAVEENRAVMLRFDRYGESGDEDRFERLVSQAASLALHLAHEDVDVGLVSDDWRPAPGPPESRLRSILHYLALVEMSAAAPQPGGGYGGEAILLSLRPGPDGLFG